MTTFNKTKSDDQTNIDKYRVAANVTEYHIISKLIFLKDEAIIALKKYRIRKKRKHHHPLFLKYQK